MELDWDNLQPNQFYYEFCRLTGVRWNDLYNIAFYRKLKGLSDASHTADR